MEQENDQIKTVLTFREDEDTDVKGLQMAT